MKRGRLFIGTSGWAYPWENFYPADLASRDYLKYYSRHFPTTEVNYSFYRLPKPTTYDQWAVATPENFILALKLSRFITHIKRLKGIRQPLTKFLENARPLGRKLGPILVQLPPSFRVNPPLLETFLRVSRAVEKKLRLALRWAFEFRHRTWFAPSAERAKALAALKRHQAAFVFGHSSRYPYPEDEPVTADFVYLRFHGPDSLFSSKYGPRRIKPWVSKIRRWLKGGHDVYAYFNNDFSGLAVDDARTLQRLVSLTSPSGVSQAKGFGLTPPPPVLG